MRVERCDTAVGLVIARNPTAPALRAAELKAGCSVADMIAHAVNIGAFGEGLSAEQVADELRDLRVYVDGEPLPFASAPERLASLDIRPPAGAIVNLQVEPAGSNNSARTALTVILTAVAIVAAFTVGPFTAALWQLGASIVPQLAFPIKAPDNLAPTNDRGGLQNQSNPMRRRGMMPLQLGGGQVAFDLVANAYTSTVGEDVWLTAIFGAHYGPCSVEDEKIGETLLADWPAEDIRVERFLTPGPRDFSFYASIVHPGEVTQDELELGGAPEVHTTHAQCERVEVDLTWPSGLQFRKANGSILQQETRIQIEYAPVGTESWQAAPLEGGPYRSRTNAVLPTGTVDVIARTADPVRRTFAWTKSDAAQVKVRVRAWDPDYDDPAMATQAVYWTGLRSIEFKKPVVDQNLACIAISVRSSDDLGGQLPVFTGVVTPHAPVYQDGEWLDDMADWAPTSNAAALTRMMLMGPGAAKPKSPGQFDASCGEMYELIEARGWTACYRLASEVTQEQALVILGQMGRFSVYDAGEGLTFIPDWEKDFPRQVFSGTNVENYSYTRTFPQPCHAMVVEFLNADEDAKEDELIVYNAGQSAETAQLFETARIPYAITGDRAMREGHVILAKRNLQVEVHSWTAGADAIACHYGARVLVRHPSALFGVGEGRVQFRHMAGGLVAGIRLNDEVVMEAGQDYALDVRRSDRVIPGMAVVTAPGRVRDLWFPTPVAPEDAPMAEDLVVFGRVGQVTEDLEISDFARSGDKITISARRYLGPQIAAAETGDIPTFQSQLTPTVKAPRPRLLGQPQATPDGVSIAFAIDEARGGAVAGFPIRWRRSSSGTDENPWQSVPAAGPTARVAQTPPLVGAVSAGRDPQAEYRVDVEIRCKLTNGDISQPLLCSDILITRDVLDPTSFTATGVKRVAASGAAYPALAIAADAIDSGLVQDLIVETKTVGQPDTAYQSAGQPLPALNPVGDYGGVLPGSRLDVRAAFRTSDNWISQWVTVSNVEIPANSLVADNTTKVGDTTDVVLAAALADLRRARIDLQTARSELRLEIDEKLRQLSEMMDGRPLAPVISEQRTVLVNTNLTVGKNTTAIRVETLARQTAVSAETYERTILRTNFEGFQSSATSQLTSLSTNQGATAADVTSLTLTVGNNKATADQSLLTLTTTTQALSSADISLAATMAGNKASADQSISALTTTTQALASADISLAATMAGNKASADQSISTLTTSTQALSTSQTNLTATVAGNTASISQVSTAQATTDGKVSAVVGFALDVNGKVAGLRFANDGKTSNITFNADYVRITGDLIVDGAITTSRLADGAVTTAKVPDGAITTSLVANAAISQMAASEAQWGMSFGTGSESTHMSFGLVSDGGKHLINVYGEIGTTTSAAAGAAIRLYCDGNYVCQGYVYCPGSWGALGASFPGFHQPGAGYHTYEVRYVAMAGSGPVVANRSFAVISELKR